MKLFLDFEIDLCSSLFRSKSGQLGVSEERSPDSRPVPLFAGFLFARLLLTRYKIVAKINLHMMGTYKARNPRL